MALSSLPSQRRKSFNQSRSSLSVSSEGSRHSKDQFIKPVTFARYGPNGFLAGRLRGKSLHRLAHRHFTPPILLFIDPANVAECVPVKIDFAQNLLEKSVKLGINIGFGGAVNRNVRVDRGATFGRDFVQERFAILFAPEIEPFPRVTGFEECGRGNEIKGLVLLSRLPRRYFIFGLCMYNKTHLTQCVLRFRPLLGRDRFPEENRYSRGVSGFRRYALKARQNRISLKDR